MNNTLVKIEQLEILQILALDPTVSLEAAKALHTIKSHLVDQYHNEQLVNHVERLIQPNLLTRIVNRLTPFTS